MPKTSVLERLILTSDLGNRPISNLAATLSGITLSGGGGGGWRGLGGRVGKGERYGDFFTVV